MQFIVSGIWVWAIIFVLSALKLWNDFRHRNDQKSGGGEDLNFIGTLLWTFVAMCAAPTSGLLFLIAFLVVFFP
jgi:hypothetical protein